MKVKFSNLKMICSPFPAPVCAARDLRIRDLCLHRCRCIFMAMPVVMYIYRHICMQIWINGRENLIKSLIGCSGLAGAVL